MSESLQRTFSRFTHSRKLFVGPDNKAMKFYLRPCAERARIKPMIEHGGGTISNMETKDTIRLAVRDSIVWRPKTVSTDFIDRCVDKNKLLNIEHFYIQVPSKADSDSDEDFSKKPQVKVQPLAFKRREYTYNEQVTILNYICKRRWHNQIGGNSIWKQMEHKEVVQNRTWQSLKEHFRKKIMTQLHSYKISNRDRDLLLGLVVKKSPLKGPGPASKKSKYDSDKEEEDKAEISDSYEDEEEDDDEDDRSSKPGPSGVTKRLAAKKPGLALLEASVNSKTSKKRHPSKDSTERDSEKKSRYSVIVSSSSSSSSCHSKSSLSDDELVIDLVRNIGDDEPNVISSLRGRNGDDNSTDIIETPSPEPVLFPGSEDGDSRVVTNTSTPDKVGDLVRPKLFSLKDRLQAATISDVTSNVEAETVITAMETDPEVSETVPGVKSNEPGAVKSVPGAKSNEPEAVESAEVERQEEPDVDVVGEADQEEVQRFDQLSRKQLKALVVEKCLKSGYPGVSSLQILSILSGSTKKELLKIAEDKWSSRDYTYLFEDSFPSESDDESLEED